jgi:hypothetical protein
MDHRKTYVGGCDCGQVRYEVELNLSACGERCSCSLCSTNSYWGALVEPDAFKLLAGEDCLRDDTSNSRNVHHLFCKNCGRRSFCRGDIPEIGGAYVTVNLKCLADLDLSQVPIKVIDGHSNTTGRRSQSSGSDRDRTDRASRKHTRQVHQARSRARC